MNANRLHDQALAAILRLAFEHRRNGAALARGGHLRHHLAGGGGGGGPGSASSAPGSATDSSSAGTSISNQAQEVAPPDLFAPPAPPAFAPPATPENVQDVTAPMPGQEDPETTPEAGLAPEVGPGPNVTAVDKSVQPPATPETTTVEKGFQATPFSNPQAVQDLEDSQNPVGQDPVTAESAMAAEGAMTAAMAANPEGPTSADAEVAQGQAAEGQAQAEADAADAAAADTSGATDSAADWKGGSVRGHHDEIAHLMRRLIDAYERQGRR